MSQLRLQPRRYVAVLLAIVLGTLFLAAALLVTSSAKETTKHMLGATYANADLLIVADTPGGSAAPELQELVGTTTQSGSLHDVAGVSEVYPVLSGAATMVLPEDSEHQGTFDTDSDFVYATNRPDDASLISFPFTAGALPETDTEIAIDADAAQRHDLRVGDTVTLGTIAEDTTTDVVVSGIVDQSMDPTVVGAITAYVTNATLDELAGDSVAMDMAMLRVDGNIDQVIAEVQQALDAAGVSATVNTPDVQITEELVDMMGFDAITVVLGGFALIALLVMMLVINNTFSVLVAQRTRQYALQRVLGATRGQIRKAVLAESVLIGLIGSVAGVVLAIALMYGLLTLAGQWIPGATFGMDASLAWVLLVGVVMTVVASWAPAAHATRVAPLEAMRPVPAVTATSKAGVFRIVVGALMTLGGGAGLVFFATQGLILAAIVAGAISFIGVLALGVLFVPSAVYALGWLPRITGVPGKMAQLNAVRNRSRTAATATALIVGTTLVALILTGGRTAQQNTDDLLASNYPVDIYANLTQIDPTDPAALASTTEQLETTAGIGRAETLVPVGVIEESWSTSQTLLAGDPADLAQISEGVTADEAQALQEPGTVLVPASHEAATLTVETAEGQQVELDVVRSALSTVEPVVSTATGEQLGVNPAGSAVTWLAVEDPELSAAELQELVSTMVAESEVSAQDVTSPLIMRALYQQIIDTVMLTVIGLLGISVLIAFVGVANTLALSALERTRENSLMRALGLTKRGLRTMLMWEAILISAVGALLGSALGMLYGWAGSTAIFAQVSSGGVNMTWPWGEVAVVIMVAIIAGLIASVAPSHRAAKLSPITGLAAE